MSNFGDSPNAERGKRVKRLKKIRLRMGMAPNTHPLGYFFGRWTPRFVNLFRRIARQRSQWQFCFYLRPSASICGQFHVRSKMKLAADGRRWTQIKTD